MIRHAFAALVKPAYVRLRDLVTEMAFDRRHGVRTAGVISTAELGFTGTARSRYRPAGLTSLPRILRRREVGPNDVFLDLGSGMGRVVLQAALRYRFRRIVGVELSTRLHDIARCNVDRVRARLGPEIVLVNADVLDYDVPDDVTVVFLYNPFGGHIFRTVVQRLLASVDRSPRSLRIIYGNPVEEAVLLATGRVEKVRELRGWRPTKEWSESNGYRMYRVLPGGGAAR